MDFKTVALVIIALAAVTFLVLVALVVFVAVRYRASIAGILGLLAGSVWVASPVDPIPEAIFGPFGLADDLGVVVAMGLYVARLAARHRALRAPISQYPSDRYRPDRYRPDQPHD